HVGTGTTGMDLNKLKQALDFQKARLSENKIKQLSNEKQIRKLNEEIEQRRIQLSELHGKARNNTSDIAVKVEAKASGTGTFRISYLVKNASWYPTYDLRANDVNKPVDLIFRANITQQSGEEWKNVRLVLSSGDPSVGGNKPSLKPYQIGYNVLPYTPGANITSVSGRITDLQGGGALPGVRVRVKGTSIATSSNTDGHYAIQIPSPQSVLEYIYIGYQTVERPVYAAEMNIQLPASRAGLSEVVLSGKAAGLRAKSAPVPVDSPAPVSESAPLEIQVGQGQTTVQFEVEQPYTIASDGKQLGVEIGSHHLDADYRYYAVPKLNENAYLTATLKGISDLNLMSGEANIFFEGAFLGKTLIDMQEATDTLSVSLGADKNIIIKRIQSKDQNEKAFIGSSQRAIRAFTIEALSRKNHPVNLTIQDQIPVSASSEITVEALNLSGARYAEASGMLNWDLQLQPGEKKTVDMKYQVKYPKNKPVRLE
ncbi:MAG TPA: mucoidy inhibitor MuiA family protein, partial [Sphingobacteriaceae bacterium]